MTQWLKQSTAATIKLGPFLDETDGKTAETGLTISQADIRLSKNGGDIAQTNNATGATHDELGFYDVPLDTTDTGALGRLRVAVHKSGALPVWQDFMVVPANVWDSMFGASKLTVDVDTIKTQAVTCAAGVTVLASVGTAATSTAQTGDSYALANGATGFTAIDTVVDAIKAKTDSLTFTVAGDLDANVQTWLGAAAPAMTGDAYARLGAPAGASVSADVLQIKGYVDDIGVAGAGLTAIPTIATVTNLTNLPAVTADWLTAAGVKADAVTKIQNGLATPTNITAGTITTVTNLTNAPTNGDLTATMKSSVTTAVPTTAQIKTAIEAAGGHLALILEYTGTTLDTKINTIDDFLDTEIATIVAELAKVPKSDLAVTWNATALAAINAEVADVLKTDTVEEMAQGAPPASPTITQAINYLYRKFRNKQETTTAENKVFDDAGTTVLFKETHSDDATTFTKGEYGTGA